MMKFEPDQVPVQGGLDQLTIFATRVAVLLSRVDDASRTRNEGPALRWRNRSRSMPLRAALQSSATSKSSEAWGAAPRRST